ncbi:phosphotransferase [Candidatus Microgenomates bacterium]|nr:phosphotransferase [Candidatus Microgenomates bacterium]
MIKDKKIAKKRVSRVLKELELTPCNPINKVLNNQTLRAYLGQVQDKKGNSFFLKVRVQDFESQKKYFRKSHFLGKILNKNPHFSFNKKTPRLLSSKFGSNIDYLLYEYVKGDNLGTRRFYDVIRLRMTEIDGVLYILKALLEIPIKAFPKAYDKGGTSFLKAKFQDCAALGVDKFLEKAEFIKLKKISRLPLFDKYTRFFCHGDFKPNNFIRTQKGIFVVDFETSLISNQFFDFFSIWAYAIRKPRWRKTLMKRFLEEYQFRSREEHILFEAEKILFLVFEIGSVLRYFERNLTRTGIKTAKRYLPVRIEELKKELRFSF